MDAYDVFKKITQGVKLSKPKPSKKDNQVKNDSSAPIKDDNDSFGILTEIKKEKFDDNDDPITLLSSLKSSNERKGKKRKKSDSQYEEKKQKLLKIEEVNHYRNLNKINAVGTKIPEPAKTFDEFDIDQDLKDNLRNCGYVEPTPVQQQAVPAMLQGRNILACAPTGSGKTAAFLVPIIQQLKQPQKLGFRALVICPTRELAKQTFRECERLAQGRGFRIHIISKIGKALTMYGPKSSKKHDILITTPNRLCYLLKQDPPAISLSNIEWLVVDEADKLFEEGVRGFREQLAEILASCSNPDKKLAMFSATNTPVVAKWCVHNMRKLIRVTVGRKNAATDSVDQELLFVGNEQGKLLAFRDLIRKGVKPPVLVFVQSKDRAQQLFHELIYDGINVDAIHADRTQLQRDNTVRSFREGKIWILICTELMARGIDFKGVNLVINYDFPPSAISYVHRIGRAGRAGRRGKSITFFTVEDQVNLRSIAHIVKDAGGEVPEYMLTMKKRPKSERKKLQKSAPKRDDIDTRPKYEKMKTSRRRRKQERQDGEKNQKGSGKDANTGNRRKKPVKKENSEESK